MIGKKIFSIFRFKIIQVVLLHKLYGLTLFVGDVDFAFISEAVSLPRGYWPSADYDWFSMLASMLSFISLVQHRYDWPRDSNEYALIYVPLLIILCYVFCIFDLMPIMVGLGSNILWLCSFMYLLIYAMYFIHLI